MWPGGHTSNLRIFASSAQRLPRIVVVLIVVIVRCRKNAELRRGGFDQDQRPGAGFLEVAQNATDLVAERFPITKSSEGLPLFGNVESFYGHWQLLK